MNKNEYLKFLRDELSVFPIDEKEAAISYYSEFFDEAGAENEQAVIASLGDPAKLAKTIIEESNKSGREAVNTDSAAPVFNPPATSKKEIPDSDSPFSIIRLHISLKRTNWKKPNLTVK